MVNFFLSLIAILLFVIIEPISFIYVVFIKKRFKFNRLTGYFRRLAINIDRFGNYQFGSLFNSTLIKSNGYKFGDFRETVSSAMGKNEINSEIVDIPWFKIFGKQYHRKFYLSTEFTKMGILINIILNTLDKNHCIKSINNFE